MATPEEAIAAAIKTQRVLHEAQREVAAQIAAQREEEEAKRGPTIPQGEPELEEKGG